MARLTNHFENDSDTGDFTPIKHHDPPNNKPHDENAPPQPPAHLIDPVTALSAPSTSATSDLSEALLASRAAALAPPNSITSEAAGDDDAFSQIGSPGLSSGHSKKLGRRSQARDGAMTICGRRGGASTSRMLWRGECMI
jgi:hypothetical protein